jgi:ribulose-phosphate 3-epimerase
MRVAPSIIAADFLQLPLTIETLNRSEADYIHCDIMDGVFVPNITFGMSIMREIASVAQKPLEAHLMIQNAEKFIMQFQEAGATVITVHYEGNIHLHRLLMEIKKLGCQAGVALNPATPIEVIRDLLPEPDLICLMSVNPGFYGQTFIPQSLSKIDRLKNLIVKSGARTLIEVDGGVNFENIEAIAKAGADIVVGGNAVFRHPEYTLSQAISLLKSK